MTIERRKLSDLDARLQRRHWLTLTCAPGARDARMLTLTTLTNRPLLQVSTDNLFDCDGNFFEDDLP